MLAEVNVRTVLSCRSHAQHVAMAYLDAAVEYVKPPEQLELSDKDLKEEFTKVLRADNPTAPENTCRFSHKEKTYKMESSVDQTILHYQQACATDSRHPPARSLHVRHRIQCGVGNTR